MYNKVNVFGIPIVQTIRKKNKKFNKVNYLFLFLKNKVKNKVFTLSLLIKYHP